jgi:hypothetical protein
MINKRLQWQFWLIFAGICGVITWLPLHVDWSAIGVIVLVLAHVIPHETARRVVPPLVAAGAWLLPSATAALSGDFSSISIFSVVFSLGSVLAAGLLYGYNGQRGPRMKWTFYIAYPAHLAAIGLAALALGLTHFPPPPNIHAFFPWL